MDGGDQSLLAAIFGAIAGLVTGTIGAIIGPFVQGAIQEQKDKTEYRRKKIQDWRAELNNFNGTLVEASQLSVYTEIRGHLKPIIRIAIDTGKSNELFSWFYTSSNDVAVLMRGFLAQPYIRSTSIREILLDEVTRIEKNWRLI
jgi:hypothetical protein